MKSTRAEDELRLVQKPNANYWFARSDKSQRQVARETGISEAQISLIVNAKRVLRPAEAAAIAKALGIGVDDFSTVIIAKEEP